MPTTCRSSRSLHSKTDHLSLQIETHKHICPPILRKPQIASTLIFQKRFASDEFKESEPVATQEGETIESPIPPETTSADQLDLSEIQENEAEDTSMYQVQGDASDENAPTSASQEGAQEQSASSSVAQEISQKASNAAQLASEATASAASTMSGTASSLIDTRSAQPSDPLSRRTLYIGNLFFDVKEDDLKREFSKFGSVESVKMIYDGRGLSKGYASYH